MSVIQSVVARFLDGRTASGTTNDFSPEQASFSVYTMGSKAPIRIQIRELKAVFFVKSLLGDSDRRDVRLFLGPPRQGEGTKVAVRFGDGEVICGYTDGYDPAALGFYLKPAGENSNNKLAYILAHAIDVVRMGPEAEALLRESLDKSA